MAGGTVTRNNEYIAELNRILKSARNRENFTQTVVDAPFHNPLFTTHLGLGIVVLLKVSEDGSTINRIALSQTLHAEGATRSTEKPFNKIVIPAEDKKNIIALAVRTGETQKTEDWKDLFIPALSAASARFNQASAGIVRSIVQPLNVKPHGGALIFSLFHNKENESEIENFINYYAKLVSRFL